MMRSICGKKSTALNCPTAWLNLELQFIQEHFFAHMRRAIVTIGLLDDAHLQGGAACLLAQSPPRSGQPPAAHGLTGNGSIGDPGWHERNRASPGSRSLPGGWFSLSIIAHDQHSPARNINVQAGKISKIRQRKMRQAHKGSVLLRGHLRGFAFHLPNFIRPIGKHNPIQMIHLMLENARQPTLGFDGHRLAAAVQAFDGQRLVAFHIPGITRDGKASLLYPRSSPSIGG